jgi:hypothetical protein
MNRNLWINTALGAALLLTAGTAQAQGPHRGGPGGPGGGPMELMGFEDHGGKLVKGAPFSATATSDTSETLSDGTVIHRTAQISLFRDGQGRSRHEVTTSGFGPISSDGAPKTFVMIADPVAQVHYRLDASSKTAFKETMRQHSDDADSADSFRTRQEAEEAKQIAAGTLKKESLGTQVINGVSAEGTRITKIIPAGKIGNDRAINTVYERWVSTDLQIVVKSTRTSPRDGTITYQVTNLQKAEPAATLFAVPAGYAVQAGGPHGHGRGPGGPGGPAADAPPPANE